MPSIGGWARVFGHNTITVDPRDPLCRGRVRGTTELAGIPAILPAITGTAWLTAFHQYVLDPSDPFPTGYRLNDTWPSN